MCSQTEYNKEEKKSEMAKIVSRKLVIDGFV